MNTVAANCKTVDSNFMNANLQYRGQKTVVGSQNLIPRANTINTVNLVPFGLSVQEDYEDINNIQNLKPIACI